MEIINTDNKPVPYVMSSTGTGTGRVKNETKRERDIVTFMASG